MSGFSCHLDIWLAYRFAAPSEQEFPAKFNLSMVVDGSLCSAILARNLHTRNCVQSVFVCAATVQGKMTLDGVAVDPPEMALAL